MSPKVRIIAKSLSWQALGLAVMAIIGYAHTGSWAAGGGIAVSGAIAGFLTYGAHEWLWDRFALPPRTDHKARQP